jgi:hypothetical protein
MAIFTRKSMINNIPRTLQFPQYTQDEFDTLYNAYKKGNLTLEEAFNNVSPGAKHFIRTGTTIEEWDMYVNNSDNSPDF